MFGLKRGLGSSKGKKKLKPSATFSGGFNESSDSDNEYDFKSAMAAKLKKVDKLINKKEPVEIDEATEVKVVNAKKPGETMERILEAKRLRDQDHQSIQHRQKESQLQNYLKENTDAMVFSTKEYERQQDESRKLAIEIEERDKVGGSFYSSLINSRTGTPNVIVKKETTKEIVKDVKQNITGKEANVSEGLKDSMLQIDKVMRKRVLEFIRSKISETDIIELQRKYWERKQVS